ncbi:MAG: cytochrome P450 [Actinobacteria bacterium]|nr:MAG: cytochrome P450 [Actinomycetota bacterium]
MAPGEERRSDGAISLPPGPRRPAAVQALEWALRPATFLERCHRDYGDLFTVRLDVGRAPRVLIAEPQTAARLLSDPSLTKIPDTRASIAPVFGEEWVLLANGAKHIRRRRQMLPAFHGDHLQGYREKIVAATDSEIARWPLSQPIALRGRLQSLTLQLILVAVLGSAGEEVMEETGRKVESLLAIVANRRAALAVALPDRARSLLARGALGRARSSLDAVIVAEIERRRRTPAGGVGSDALAHLLQPTVDGEEALRTEVVCDQVRTLLLAGHESTATSLAWTLEHLVHAPNASKRLREEARSIGGDGGEAYTEAVLTESLRLSPPLANTQRQLTKALPSGPYTLVPGTLVTPCAYLIHRRPDLYPAPNEFRPERFLSAPPTPAAWLPFGGGPRRCLGASFARLQMNLILRRLFQRLSLEAVSAMREPVQRRGIVLAPANGAEVVVTKRLPP